MKLGAVNPAYMAAKGISAYRGISPWLFFILSCVFKLSLRNSESLSSTACRCSGVRWPNISSYSFQEILNTQHFSFHDYIFNIIILTGVIQQGKSAQDTAWIIVHYNGKGRLHRDAPTIYHFTFTCFLHYVWKEGLQELLYGQSRKRSSAGALFRTDRPAGRPQTISALFVRR